MYIIINTIFLSKQQFEKLQNEKDQLDKTKDLLETIELILERFKWRIYLDLIQGF